MQVAVRGWVPKHKPSTLSLFAIQLPIGECIPVLEESALLLAVSVRVQGLGSLGA